MASLTGKIEYDPLSDKKPEEKPYGQFVTPMAFDPLAETLPEKKPEDLFTIEDLMKLPKYAPAEPTPQVAPEDLKAERASLIKPDYTALAERMTVKPFPTKSFDPDVQKIYDQMSQLIEQPQTKERDDRIEMLREKAVQMLAATSEEAERGKELGELKRQESDVRTVESMRRGYLGGVTAGLSDIAFKGLDKADQYKYEYKPETLSEYALQGVSAIPGAILTGRGIAGAVAPLLKTAGPLAQTVIPQFVAASSMGLSQAISNVITDKADVKEASKDFAQNMGGWFLSMASGGILPKDSERYFRPFVQVATDITYDLFTDAAVRDILKNPTDLKELTDWFVTRELPNVISSVVGAGIDFSDKNYGARMKIIRDDIRTGFKDNLIKFTNKMKGVPDASRIREEAKAPSEEAGPGEGEVGGVRLRDDAEARLATEQPPGGAPEAFGEGRIVVPKEGISKVREMQKTPLEKLRDYPEKFPKRTDIINFDKKTRDQFEIEVNSFLRNQKFENVYDVYGREITPKTIESELAKLTLEEKADLANAPAWERNDALQTILTEKKKVSKESLRLVEESKARENIVKESVSTQMANRLGVKVEVVRSIEDVKDADVKAKLQRGDKGVYVHDPATDTKTVYLISDNITNKKDAMATYLHEVVGHAGLRGLVKGESELNGILDKISSGQREAEINKIAETYGFDLTKPEDRMSAAEEYFANQVEKGKIEVSIWKKLRYGVRELFQKKNIALTNDDLDVIINRIYDVTLNERPAALKSTARQAEAAMDIPLIEESIKAGAPVSASMVERNNYPLPKEYTRQGDLFVVKKQEAETVTPQPKETKEITKGEHRITLKGEPSPRLLEFFNKEGFVREGNDWVKYKRIPKETAEALETPPTTKLEPETVQTLKTENIFEGPKNMAKNVDNAIRYWFANTGVAAPELGKIHKEFIRISGTETLKGQIASDKLQLESDALSEKFGNATVQDVLMDVLKGKKTIDDLTTLLDLTPESNLVKTTQKAIAEKAKSSEMIAEYLRSQGREDLADTIIKNKDNYMNTSYLLHMLGKNFIPDPASVKATTKTVEAETREKLSNVATRMTKLSKEIEAPAEKLIEYFNTGNRELIKSMTPEQQTASRVLRDRYMEMRDLFDTAEIMRDQEGKTVESIKLVENAKKIAQYAIDTVDYVLQNQISKSTKSGQAAPIDVNHLARKTLEEPWKTVFSEVKNVHDVVRRSTEIQQNLINNLWWIDTMYQKQDAKGNPLWWSVRPTKEHTKQLPVDLRFGKLSGKFVDATTHNLLTEKDVYSAWNSLVGYGRMAMLAGSIPYYARNLISNTGSWLFNSGDAAIIHKKGADGKRFSHTDSIKESIKFQAAYTREAAKRLVTKKPTKELIEMEEYLLELAQGGVFNSRTSPLAMDIRQGLKSGSRPKRKASIKDKIDMLREGAGKLLAWSDFVFRDASYRSQLRLGKSKADAAQHVRDLYPNPELTRKITREVGKTGFLMDFPGYFDSSTVANINGLKHGLKEANKKNFAPMLTWMIGNSMLALGSAKATQALGGIAAWTTEKLYEIFNDDNIENVSMNIDDINAIRTFNPGFYIDAPMIGWDSTDKNGEFTRNYIVLSGIHGTPLIENITAYLQSQGGTETRDPITAILKQFLSQGRLTQTVAKALTGREIGIDAEPSKYKAKGIFDWMQATSSDKTEKMLGLAVNAAVDSGIPMPPRTWNNIKFLEEAKEQVKAKQLSQKEYDRRKDEAIRSEYLPIKVKTIDKKRAESMLKNKLGYEKYQIDFEKERVSPAVKYEKLYGGTTQPQFEEKMAGEKNLEIKYRRLRQVIHDAKVAFRRLLSDDDIYRIMKEVQFTEQEISGIKRDRDIEYKAKPRIKPWERRRAEELKKEL